LLFDNHNSVNGIREFARAKGASFTYLPVMAPDLRVEEDLLFSFLEQNTARAHRLFAYPVQSNFTGVQHPLEWIAEAQARGWHVLLDGAAFVPTNRWTFPGGIPILSRSRSTRCSATRRVLAACWRAKQLWPHCTAPGSPVARSGAFRCRAMATSCFREVRHLKTAPSTISACPPSKLV